MNENVRVVSEDIVGIKNTIEENYVELNERLGEYMKQNADLEDRLEAANERIDPLLECNLELYQQTEKAKDEKKLFNVIIRGVPEKANEKLYETIEGILGGLQTTFNYTNTNGAVRLGKPPKQLTGAVNGGQGNHNKAGQAKRTPPPRPIKLCCATRQQKGEIFRGIPTLKQMQGMDRVSVSSDIPDGDMLAYKEVQILHNAVLSIPNSTSKMKGNAIEIDGKVYQQKDFDKLPHNLSLEHASTIVAKDGVMFASHCSPLSNLSESRITEEDTVYRSAEQRIVHKLALLSDDMAVATIVFFESNPYKIKSMSKQIKKSAEWSIEKEKEIVKESMIMKFEQNSKLKEKLLKCKATNFYEATYDATYGAGFNLQDVQRGNTTPRPNCNNFAGKVLTEAKAQFHKEKK